MATVNSKPSISCFVFLRVMGDIMYRLLLVNDKDQILDYEEKIKTHKKGLLHRAFSVFIVDEEKKKCFSNNVLMINIIQEACGAMLAAHILTSQKAGCRQYIEH